MDRANREGGPPDRLLLLLRRAATHLPSLGGAKRQTPASYQIGEVHRQGFLPRVVRSASRRQWERAHQRSHAMVVACRHLVPLKGPVRLPAPVSPRQNRVSLSFIRLAVELGHRPEFPALPIAKHGSPTLVIGLLAGCDLYPQEDDLHQLAPANALVHIRVAAKVEQVNSSAAHTPLVVEIRGDELRLTETWLHACRAPLGGPTGLCMGTGSPLHPCVAASELCACTRL